MNRARDAATDGDITDGDITDGDMTDGDMTIGDTDGDMTDGDTAEADTGEPAGAVTGRLRPGGRSTEAAAAAVDGDPAAATTPAAASGAATNTATPRTPNIGRLTDQPPLSSRPRPALPGATEVHPQPGTPVQSRPAAESSPLVDTRITNPG